MLTRIISGIIGIGIAAFVIQTGGLIFALFCLMLLAEVTTARLLA